MSGTLRRSSKVLDLYSCPSDPGRGLFYKVSSSRWCLAGLLPSMRKLQVFISDLPLNKQQKLHGNKTKDTRTHAHGAFPVDRVHVLLVLSALSSSPSPTFRLQTLRQNSVVKVKWKRGFFEVLKISHPSPAWNVCFDSSDLNNWGSGAIKRHTRNPTLGV